MHRLDDKELSIVRDVFNLTTTLYDGVDSLNYRAQNAEQLDLLDKLEREGYLRKENEKYWISLIALVQLHDEKTELIINNAETIFAELKAYYKENQREQLKLSDLAERVEISIEEVKESLSYMVEGSWWGGRTTDFYSSQDAYIKPSESILRYDRFSDVISQLQDWQTQRIEDRDKPQDAAFWSNNLLRSPLMSASTAEREKPVWFDNLSQDIQILLNEVYLAFAFDMRALPSMGLRTVIDMVCNDLVDDIGSFKEKLDAMEGKGFINGNEKAILAIIVDVGSATAHRGHNPTKEDLNTSLDIIEHLLKGIYVLRPASERLKESTPPRKR
jgi:hypothetical protein